MPTQIFLNFPVNDLPKTKEFFAALGYTFNPQFTDDNAACMVISDTIYVMLLTKPFFKGFTKKQIADSSTIEAITAVSVDSREEVDDKFTKALAAGGKKHNEAQDHGWMYSQSIEDLDGHIWEFVWMDPKGIQK
jgi:predicted lactoylglutathione lyase